MNTTGEARVIYAAGLVQGITLVTFPAASTIFTDPSRYHLSASQYGVMFAPQTIVAIAAALLGASLTRSAGIERVYLAGLVANLASMVALLTSQVFVHNHALAYGLLLAATTCLGAGFGLTVPALNTLTAALHPAAIDRSVLTLNALLGLGTALAPVFVAVFVGLGFWWGLPVLAALLLVVLLGASWRLPARVGTAAGPAESGDGRIPGRFWLFAVFGVLYGFCETMNGNWSEVDMVNHLGASAAAASLALTAFWTMVTAGRVLSALVERWVPTHRTYNLLPFLLTAAFVVIALLPHGSPGLGVAAFALAGLGCSALLPLTVSFGQEQLVVMSASVSGGIIASYQVGYGIAAFGTGPLLDAGVAIPRVFAFAAVAAAAAGVLSFVIAGRRTSAL